MHDRRIYHARGKILGGSSSINGMIFQRGNPLDYDGWAAEPGMAAWDYAHCLPYFKRMEDALEAAPDDPFRGHGGPLILERGPATNPLFGAFFEAATQAGYARTDDVNGFRQEGLRQVRPQHPPRTPSVGGNGLPRPGDGPPEPRGPDLGAGVRPDVRRPSRHRRRVPRGPEPPSGRGGRGDPVRRRDQLAAAAPALGDRPCRPSPRSSGSSPWSICRGRREPPGSSRGLHPASEQAPGVDAAGSCQTWRRPWIGFQWLFLRRGPGATNHFEGGGFVRGDDDVAYPNLMFHFLPLAIRYDGSGPKGGHGYQVHVGPMYSDARGSVRIRSTDPREHPALRFNYLSTEQDRREWLEAVHVARDILGQPAMAPYDAGETSPGPWRRERCGDPRLGRPRRGDRAPSLMHGEDGNRRWRSSIRRACGSTASTASASSTPRSSRASPTPTSTPR